MHGIIKKIPGPFAPPMKLANISHFPLFASKKHAKLAFLAQNPASKSISLFWNKMANIRQSYQEVIVQVEK